MLCFQFMGALQDAEDWEALICCVKEAILQLIWNMFQVLSSSSSIFIPVFKPFM